MSSNKYPVFYESVPYMLKSEQIPSSHVPNPNIATNTSDIHSAQIPYYHILSPIAKFSEIYTLPITPIEKTNRHLYVNKNHRSSHSRPRSSPSSIRIKVYFRLDRARENCGNIFRNYSSVYFLRALLNYIHNNSGRKRVIFSKLLIREAYCTSGKEYN